MSASIKTGLSILMLHTNSRGKPLTRKEAKIIIEDEEEWSVVNLNRILDRYEVEIMYGVLTEQS